MNRSTKNLTAPVTLRLRHHQDEELNLIISQLSESEIKNLLDVDQARFKYPELFKNTGASRNPKLLIIRLALDEWISRHKKDDSKPAARQVLGKDIQPSLFDNLEDEE